MKVLDESPGGVGGVRHRTLLFTGEDAFGLAQYEDGFHRLIRMRPPDPAGSGHSSVARVRVLPCGDGTKQQDDPP